MRTDAANPQGRLDAFLRVPASGGGRGVKRPCQTDDQPSTSSHDRLGHDAAARLPASNLYSVRSLLGEVDRKTHAGLAALFRQPTYVGLADKGLAVVQHGTKLYLLCLATALRELGYQQALRLFERAPRLTLSAPAPLRPLLLAALDTEVFPFMCYLSRIRIYSRALTG